MSDARQTNAIDQVIGKRVRQRRLELRMSQEGLSDRVGVTFQQIQKYEKGVNRIAASRLFDLAASLETSVGYFFEGTSGKQSTNSPSSATDDVLATVEGQKLLRVFASIKNIRVRKRIVDLAQALADEDAKTVA